MKTAQVRELKNKTSELLRLAAKEDIVITSRGKPVACLIGIRPRTSLLVGASPPNFGFDQEG
jgi:prevent-host-death family protein